MSVERKTIIIVGMPLPVFEHNCEIPSDLDEETIEAIVDRFYFDTDSWSGGKKFVGREVLELEEGESVDLDEFLSCQELDDEKQALRADLFEYGIESALSDIKTYIIFQVF